MSVQWVWSVNTDSGFSVKARLDAPAATARLVASLNLDLSSPTYSDSVAPDADGYLDLHIDSLAASSVWHYGIEVDSTIDPIRGKVRTLPADGAPASFEIGFASCAQTNPGRDYPVYQRINEKPLVQFIHLGDFHYDIPDDPDPDTWVAADWQGFVDKALSRPNRASHHRAMAVPSTWDDHDYNPNQVGSATFPKKDVVAGVYRQTRPHYPIQAADPGDNAIYQSWRIGRVWFILADLRYHRDQYNEVPMGTATMLGATQKQWVKDQLVAARDAGAPLIVFCSSSIWTSEVKADTWGPASAERAELAAFSVDEGIPPVIVISGDMHGLAWAEGMPLGEGTRPWPEHVSASLGAAPGGGRPSPHWTYGHDMGMGSYSVLEVTDDGTDFSYTVTGYRADLVTGVEEIRYQTVDNVLVYPETPEPPAERSRAVVRTWDGNHWAPRPVRTRDGAKWLDRPVAT